jgi:hypothetical protein
MSTEQLVVFDLLDEARHAVWLSNAGRLPFGKSRNDPRGFAIYPDPYLQLEDGSTEEVLLETHPQWTPDGWIRGEFFLPQIGKDQMFRSSVGFIMPSGEPMTNGVLITIRLNRDCIYQGEKLYTGEFQRIEIDLGRFEGLFGVLSLEVDANGDSTQDWLVWKKPRVE